MGLFTLYLICCAASLWIYGGYLFVLLIFSFFRNTSHSCNDNWIPGVTIFIPAYNEEGCILKKLENTLSLDYPRDKLQILVVDSGSTDTTVEKTRAYEHLGVELIRQPERKGKGSAIVFGLGHAKHEIVVVTDTNAHCSPQALKLLVRHFCEKNVGGVTGKFLGFGRELGAESEGTEFFREYENKLKEFETGIDSAVCLWGELMAARKHLFSIDEHNVSEDFDTSLFIRSRGLRLVYEPNAVVREDPPSTLEDAIIQKRRVIVGTIQCLFKYRRMLFNPRYGLYGMFILPGHKLASVLSPFFLIPCLALSAVFWKTFLWFLLILIPVFVIFLGIVFKSLRRGFRQVIQGIYYIGVLNFACLLAWKDYLTGNYSVKWKKTKSSRS